MKEDKKRIGEILIDAGVINSMQLSVALGEQKQWGGRLCSILVRLGFVDERAIAQVLERQFGMECISLENREISPEALKKVKVEVARKYGVIPVEIQGSALVVAMSDPTDLRTLDELGFVVGMRMKPVLALESAISKAIALHYEGVAAEGVPHKSILGAPPEREKVLKDERFLTPPALSEKTAGADRRTERKEIPVKTIVEALVSLLMEKGLIAREELIRKIKEKDNRN